MRFRRRRSADEPDDARELPSEPEAEPETLDPDEQPLGVLLHVGKEALGDGNGDAAEWILRSAERRFPDDPDVVLGLGDALLMLEHPQAEPYVRRAVELADGDPVRLTRAANQLLAIGDTQGTAALVEWLWSNLAPPELEYAPELMHLTGRLGVAAGYEDEDSTPERMLEGAFECEPENVRFAIRLAQFHAENGRSGRALEVLQHALEYNPDAEELLVLRADVRARDDRHE